MKKFFYEITLIILMALIFPLQLLSSVNLDDETIVKIHYLGHSSFVLQFDNGITVVTDHGHFNAWIDYGWNSPIHSFNDLVPDVMTFSHFHADHYDSTRIPEGVTYVLSEFDSLTINGLEIKPVRTCEESIVRESNSSYIFKYKGLTICHLGDAQAQIIQIENETVRNRIQEIIPDSLDLFFMTIEGTSQFTEQAEMFVDLLKPKRIIPMHYWSTQSKRLFLLQLTKQNVSEVKYTIENLNTSIYDLELNESFESIKVIDLTRSSFTGFTSVDKEENRPFKYKLNQNYPNPFNPNTKIMYSIPHQTDVKIRVFDVLGCELATLVDERKSAGNYDLTFNASQLPSGIYIYQLITNEFTQSKKMILLR
ncbi:MAG: MBL fold metallo-hydrolase [Bacteroidota bacterium]